MVVVVVMMMLFHCQPWELGGASFTWKDASFQGLRQLQPRSRAKTRPNGAEAGGLSLISSQPLQ